MITTVFGSIQFWLSLALLLGAFALEVWALIDCLSRPTAAFPAAGKRTKTFWLAITGAAALIGFLSLPPMEFLGIFFALIAAGAALLYLVDVRPATRGPKRGPRSTRGGW